MSIASCGTPLSDEAFASGPRWIPAVPEKILPDVAIPDVSTRDGLSHSLSDKSAAEIVRILGCPSWIERFGPPSSTIPSFVDDFSAVSPERAYGLCSEAWKTFSIPALLPRLVSLACKNGKPAEAVSYARIARMLGETVDPFEILSAMPVPEGIPIFESVLSDAITEDPFDVPWVSDVMRARVLSALRRRSDAFAESLAERLDRLQFWALTLLDTGEFAAYVDELHALASSGGDDVLLSHALASFPSVAKEYLRSVRADVSESENEPYYLRKAYRCRLMHAADHFSQPENFSILRKLAAFHSLLGDDEFAAVVAGYADGGENILRFYEALPDGLRGYRSELLEYASLSYGGAHYPRLFSRALRLSLPVRLPDFRIAALVIVDSLAAGIDFWEVVPVLERQISRVSDSRAAFLIASALVARGVPSMAVRWLDFCDPKDSEVLSLRLRIVSEMRDATLSAGTVEFLCRGAPVTRPQPEYALSRVRAAARSIVDPAVSHEMVGDAETAFGSPSNALESYWEAAENGNDDALWKAGRLAFAMENWEMAKEAYGRLRHAGIGTWPSAALCLIALREGDRSSADRYAFEMDPKDPENVPVIAEYHCVPGNVREMFAGILLLADLPVGSVRSVPSEIRREYEKFAETFAGNVPNFSDWHAVPKSEDGFWERLALLRALPIVLESSVSDAVAYVRYLESAFAAGWKNPAIGAAVFPVFCEMVAQYHGPKYAGAYSQAGSHEARRNVMAQLFLCEAHALVDIFRPPMAAPPPIKDEYVHLLLRIADVCRILVPEGEAIFREAIATFASPGLSSGYVHPPVTA